MDSGIVLMDVDHSGHVNILQALHDRMVDEGTLTPEAEMHRLVKLRDSMSDADYRTYLFAKLALFTWDGANDSAQAFLARLFPGSTLCDNCNGTVTVHPVSALQSAQKIYPLPAGVRAIIS